MKILILVDQVFCAGGLERSLAHKISFWHRAGHAIELVTIEGDGRPDFYQFPESMRRTKLDIRYDRNVSLLTLRNLREAIRHFLRLRATLRKSHADVIIHCGFGFDFYFLPILRQKKALLIKENHSSRYSGQMYLKSAGAFLKHHLRRFFDERYDACVFLSAEEAVLGGVRNAVVIPNPMPDLCPHTFTKRNVVIAAGRICRIKGFDRLIRAWAIVASHAPQWHLEIYGDGEKDDVDGLQRMIDGLGLADQASIFPATPKIFDRIGESRIFAMTSRSECFPMVLLEAMQLGVPIIAFDCPTGPRNILSDKKTGLLIQDGDIEAFAAALLELILSDADQVHLARNARQEVQRYSIGEVARLWDKLFRLTSER